MTVAFIRITYCDQGYLHLAAIIDGFSRKVVGYALGRTLCSMLTIAMLDDAIRTRDTANLTHHPDQGFQYCSREYVKIIESN